MITFLSSRLDGYGNLVNEYEVCINDPSDKHHHFRPVFLKHDPHGWTATEENYDGPEDQYRIAHHATSEIEAMNQLVEKLEENYHKLF